MAWKRGLKWPGICRRLRRGPRGLQGGRHRPKGRPKALPKGVKPLKGLLGRFQAKTGAIKSKLIDIFPF